MDRSGMFAFQNRFTTMHSAYAPPNSKAMAFPIVAFALVLTTLILYTTGTSNTTSVITLLSVALFILFGSLVYAFLPASGVSGPSGVNWKGISLALTAAIVALLAILLIVHYTIRPIFKVKNAGPGFIPVPTVAKESSGKYWTSSSTLLKSADTVLGDGDDGTYDYSLTLDVLIVDPNVASNIDRPIFSRSDTKFTGSPVTAEGVTIAQQIGNYNLAMYLDKSTNDLIVSTISVVNNSIVFENAILKNVPIQQPFRIGVIMGSKYMEVYYNGKLHSTRKLSGAPLPLSGAFIPPGQAFAAMASVRNLRLWKGVISPAEMAYLPPLSMQDFGEQVSRSLSQLSSLINDSCNSDLGVSNSVLGTVQKNMSLLGRTLSGSGSGSGSGSLSASDLLNNFSVDLSSGSMFEGSASASAGSLAASGSAAGSLAASESAAGSLAAAAGSAAGSFSLPPSLLTGSGTASASASYIPLTASASTGSATASFSLPPSTLTASIPASASASASSSFPASGSA